MGNSGPGAIQELGLAVGRQRVGGGDTVVVALTLSRPGDDPIGAVQGWLLFPADELEFLGQNPDVGQFTIVNAAEVGRGRLRFATVDAHGLSSTPAVFAFRARAGSPQLRFRLEIERAASLGLVRLRPVVRSGVAFDPVLPLVPNPRLLTLAAWDEYARAHLRPGDRGIRLSPGEGTIFGDANLDGVLNVFDAHATASVAVGNFPLLSDLTRDYVIAANVEPVNAPGLGEPDDPIPPGMDPDGGAHLDVLDALAIANAAVGNGHPVAGHPIPGRIGATERVVLSGDLVADRILARDTIYELSGTVAVRNGVTLTIEAGTRIEGNETNRGALSVRRGARLVAIGTRLQPIVFTCRAANPSPGCWGGLNLNGAALLNNGNTGSGSVIQCPERQEPSGGIYGGCQIGDASGVLKYVRIEYAGASWPGEGVGAGLTLNGVGQGTRIEDLQVRYSLGDGVFVSGGTASLREIVLTQNLGDGIRWDDGWQGKGQSLIVYRSAGGGAGLRGSNAAGAQDAGPRSFPALFNVTVVEANAGNPPGLPALLLERGTGLRLRNALVLGWTAAGLAVMDPATCALPGDSLDVASSVFYHNQPDFPSSLGCVDVAAYAAQPSRFLTVVDPQLLAPFVTQSPDLRPGFTASLIGVTPPSDGFFDPSKTFIGAVPPATMTASNIPWYAGWSVGF